MNTLFSVSIRNDILNLLAGKIYTLSQGSAYLALSSTEPSYDESKEITNVTEPSESSYERTLIGNAMQGLTQKMGTATNGTIINTEEIHFVQASEGGSGWGTLGYYAIYSDKTGGKPIIAGSLQSAITVPAGAVALVKANNLTISMGE